MQKLNNLSADFQKHIAGKQTAMVVLENAAGTQVGICNYGARITHFIVKDKNNNPVDIVLGFNTLAAYETSKERYHGVTVGPFANRIAGGSFILNNKQYQLEINNGNNCLHGAGAGFHDKVWDVVAQSPSSVSLNIVTQENEGGFPGKLNVTITYSLSNSNELLMEYLADTTEDTVVNLTNHAYFNLNASGSIIAHQVKIEADRFMPLNEDCVPEGASKDVANTPFDFRTFKSIAQDIFIDDEQLKIGKGYDHSFEMRKSTNNEFVLAATAIGDISGIKLEVLTTEPSMQFYTGNYLGGHDIGKNNEAYEDRSGFCFETQHYPDSPNQPQFPTTILRKNDKLYSKTIYKVSNQASN